MFRRNTWITLAVFLVLLVAAVWWTRSGQDRVGSADATPTQTALWEVAADQIVGIRVEYLTTGDMVYLERQEDGTWIVVQPEEGVITDDRVQRALDWLASPRPRTTIPDPADLLAFGLAEPATRVTIQLRDGEDRVFEVGADAPTGTTQYIRLPGQATVLVVSKYGLEDVLGLLEDVLPTPTPTATTAPEESSQETAPAAGTPVPGATSVPSGTLEP